MESHHRASQTKPPRCSSRRSGRRWRTSLPSTCPLNCSCQYISMKLYSKEWWYWVAGAGFFSMVLVAIPLQSRLFRKVDPGRVLDCDLSHAHQYYAEHRLDTGESIILSNQDLSGLKKCLDIGTLIEKRRGEMGWRINGRYYPANADSIYLTAFLMVGGAALGITALIQRR